MTCGFHCEPCSIYLDHQDVPRGPPVDYTLVLCEDEKDLLEKFQRRTGIDIRDWIFEMLWEDYKRLCPCLWYEKSEYECEGCDFEKTCVDKEVK